MKISVKRFLNDMFEIPKEGKIKDKNFMAYIGLSVAIIVLCLSVMGATSYAFFTAQIRSDSNSIVSANYDLIYTVDGIKNDDGSFTAVKDTEYSIKIELDQNSKASTGFCILEVDFGSGKKVSYHTVQLGADVKAAGEHRDSITFTIELAEPGTVTLKACWGTSSLYNDYSSNPSAVPERYIIEGAEISVDVPLSTNNIMMSPPPSVDDNTSANEETTVSPDDIVTEETTTSPEDDITTGDNTEPDDTTTVPEVTTGRYQPDENGIYIAKAGDTFADIANANGVSVYALLAYNGMSIDDYQLFVGDIILIPPVDWEIPVSEPESEITTAPEDTTVEPEDSTVEPEDSSDEPEDSTVEPEDITVEPEDTTVEPEDSGEAVEDSGEVDAE